MAFAKSTGTTIRLTWKPVPVSYEHWNELRLALGVLRRAHAALVNARAERDVIAKVEMEIRRIRKLMQKG